MGHPLNVSFLVRPDARAFRVPVDAPFAIPRLHPLIVLRKPKHYAVLQTRRPPAIAHAAPGLAPAVKHVVPANFALVTRHLDPDRVTRGCANDRGVVRSDHVAP